jgi:molybdenum cofactor synthesis domain-containing protein
METSGKTAAIVITGNEILSGKVAEQNAHYIAGELRTLGVHLERISILPDRVDPIAEEIAYCQPRFDLVFTSGGIGPTHDDVTLEGIAKGLSQIRVPHPVLYELLKQFYPTEVASMKKMALVPEETQLIYGNHLRTPILMVKNIYIFPGVSEFLKRKFDAIKERFRESPFYLTKIFLNLDEETMVEWLNQTVERYPDLLVGSYPVLHQTEYKVIVTLESKEVAALKQGAEALLALVPDAVVWKVESAFL